MTYIINDIKSNHFWYIIQDIIIQNFIHKYSESKTVSGQIYTKESLTIYGV